MLKLLRAAFSSTIYVQIWENRIRAVDVESKATFDEPPLVAVEVTDQGKKSITAIGKAANIAGNSRTIVVNPFSHPRSLIADFHVGEKLLQHAFKMLSRMKWLPPAPRVVIQPMEKLEGGLTAIELRAFRELGYAAGAREVKIHVGAELPVYGFDYQRIRSCEGGLKN